MLRLQPGSPAVAVRATVKGAVGQPVVGLVQVTATLVPDATLVLATLHVPVGLDASRSSRAPVLLLTVKVLVKLPAVSHKVVLCVAGDSCTLTVGWDAGVTVVDLEAEPPQLPDPADASRETEKGGQVSTPCARLHVTATVKSEGTFAAAGVVHTTLLVLTVKLKLSGRAAAPDDTVYCSTEVAAVVQTAAAARPNTVTLALSDAETAMLRLVVLPQGAAPTVAARSKLAAGGHPPGPSGRWQVTVNAVLVGTVAEGVVHVRPLPVTVSVAFVSTLLCTTKLPAAVPAFEQIPRLSGPVTVAVGAAVSVAEAVAVRLLLQPPSLWVAVRLALKPGVQLPPGR